MPLASDLKEETTSLIESRNRHKTSCASISAIAPGIEARLKGLAGKEEKLNEAIKEQKRILAAQDKASQLLGRNRGPATQTVRLDDASLNQLAKTIQDQLKK